MSAHARLTGRLRTRATAGLGTLVLVAGVGPLVLPLAAAAATVVPAGTAAVPRPDHVVIVVEENRADSKIVGSPDAPFITSPAAANADFTQSYAETHPSQPNYLALFSRSFNGITDDSCPHTLTGPNHRAAELTRANREQCSCKSLDVRCMMELFESTALANFVRGAS